MPDSTTLAVDDLLDADAVNVDLCKRLLNDLSPSILEAAEMVTGMYATLSRICSQSIDDPFAEVADVPDLHAIDSMADLEERAKADPSFRVILERYLTLEARIALILRLGTLFSQTFVDFLRMRVTAPMGYLRIQAESVALLILMNKKPALAREWVDLKTDEDGRRFFGSHQKDVRAILSDTDLLHAYDLASSGAVHSRFVGVARAMKMTHEWLADGSYHREYKLLAQEFNPNEPHQFCIMVVHALRVQELIFRAVSRHVPGIDDPIFVNSRIPRLGSLVKQAVEAVGDMRKSRDGGESRG
jgi:hypothetical protein